MEEHTEYVTEQYQEAIGENFQEDGDQWNHKGICLLEIDVPPLKPEIIAIAIGDQMIKYWSAITTNEEELMEDIQNFAQQYQVTEVVCRQLEAEAEALGEPEPDSQTKILNTCIKEALKGTTLENNLTDQIQFSIIDSCLYQNQKINVISLHLKSLPQKMSDSDEN